MMFGDSKTLAICCLIASVAIVNAGVLVDRQALTIPPSGEDATSSSEPVGSSTAIPPSPTNSGVCQLHEDHWHCDEESTPTGSGALGPSPTDQGECHAHEDHWHCENESSEEGEVVSDVGGEGCVQHGTHFHCPPGVEASCDAVDLGDYDMSLHIVAVFILLIASGLGVFTPVLFATAGLANNKWFNLGLFTLKHFGTGIIISTAFIHLLMHAFVMFANECLGELEYEAVAPAIAMAAVIAIFLVDFFAGRWISSRRSHPSPSQNSHDSHDSSDEKDPTTTAAHWHSHDHSSMMVEKQRLWDVQLLEVGVIFHSIMIGVTLGAQTGTGFIPTFCAIVFHQLFEGLGLGSRIAGLENIHWKKWIMCTLYALITPIGIGIGIGVHESFNLNSKASLLSIGILDSISAGILLYAGLCQLLVGDWLAKGSEMQTASRAKTHWALFCLGAGLFGMSLIGKWA